MTQRVRSGGNGSQRGNALLDRFPSIAKLFGGGRTNGGYPGIGPGAEGDWRQVPKLNILPSRRSTSSSVSQLRAVLLIVLVVQAYFVQDWYREVIASTGSIESVSGELRAAERQLADKQGALSAIRTQISQMQARSVSQQRELEEVSGGQIDWDVVMAALFSAETAGTTFLSVTIRPDGEVNLDGVANEADAIKNLPSQLAQTAEVLDFQSIRWTAGSVPPAFSAVFKVRR